MDRNAWNATVWLARQRGELTAQDVLTARAICRRANAAGRCWPSEATIARDAACSTRSVRRCKRRLRALGLLDWTAPRIACGRQEVCRYVLAVQPARPSGTGERAVKRPRRPADSMAGRTDSKTLSLPDRAAALAALAAVRARRAVQLGLSAG